MKLKQKSIKLYCLPAELVPEDAETFVASWSVQGVPLPGAVVRADSNPDLDMWMQWFRENLTEAGGYVVASAALPALSLDKDLWAEALDDLRGFLSRYATVTGPVFVPPMSRARSDHFLVADWYARMASGTTMTPAASYRQAVAEPQPEPEPEQVMVSNHLVTPEPEDETA